MSKDRETTARSIANLWAFNALFISQLLYSLREGGMAAGEIEAILQNLDRETEFLEGADDQLHASQMLATVRARLGAWK